MKNLEELERQYKKLGEEIKKLKEAKKHNVVNFGGYKWYIIDEDEEGYTLFMSDILSTKDILIYFNVDEMLDCDNDVRFSYVNNNSWKDSYIRHVLNSTFLDNFNLDDLVLMNCDYVRLIIREEVEKLSNEIRKSSNCGYWTMSPYSNGSSRDVWYVYSSGYIDGLNADASYGVRPIIKVKKGVIDND